MLKKLFIVFTIPLFLSGYGYLGDLPELGEPEDVEVKTINLHPKKKYSSFVKDESLDFEYKKILFPRLYSEYIVSKYSSYFEEVNSVKPLLIGIKDVVESDNPDKIQFFCARVNTFSLHMDNLKENYRNKPESNYESYKQLVLLEEILKEVSEYQRTVNKYKPTVRGSLKDKLVDEAFTRQKIDIAMISLETVLEIIKGVQE